MPSSTTTTPIPIDMNDPTQWSCLGGPWKQDEGVFTPAATEPKKGTAAYDGQDCVNTEIYRAFQTAAAYDDFDIEFRFRWDCVFCGAGLIFRAQDPNRFYLAHFPCCAQCARASHFWACISRVDENGWTTILKMEMLHGVASELSVWHTARLRVQGNCFELWVDGRPMSAVHDDAYTAPGLLGFEAWGLNEQTASFDDVKLQAEPVAAAAWNESTPVTKPWFLPYPVCDVPWDDEDYRAQQQSSTGIVKISDGTLLMTISWIKKHQILVHSTDQGRTWSPYETKNWPEGLKFLYPQSDGSITLFIWTPQRDLLRAESHDDGRSWSTSEPVVLGGFTPPESEPQYKVHGPSGILQLKDGTLVGFMVGTLGLHERHDTWEWGTYPCGAYSVRSTDGGKTWSSPIPLNGPPAVGNKWDLCECTSNVQTKKGDILSLVRPIYSPWMWEIWSSDSGQTWTPAMSGPFPCYGATALCTSSGAILVSGRMPGLGLYASHDHGMTWQAYRIDVALWAMGQMIEVEPNLVLYVYMDSDESHVRAQYLRITEDSVEPALEMLPAT